MEKNYEGLRRKYDAVVIENVEKINSLTRALDECQTQCQNLLTSKNSRDLITLQSQLDAAQQEKHNLLQKVEELQVQNYTDSLNCNFQIQNLSSF